MKQSGIDWIGEIPDWWEIYQLSQLVKQVKNKNSLLQEKNLLSLSYGSIKRKDINSSDGLLPASFDGYNIIENGDIVLRLTDLQNDHTSLRVGRTSERGIITSAYTTLHPININHSKFLYYMLHSFDLKKGFYGMGAGVRQGLNYDEVKSLKVPLPPLAEQQKIASYLDKKISQIDAIITEAKQSIEEYKAWKQSVIFEAVTGKNKIGAKKDSGIEWIGEIPEGWEVRALKTLFSIFSGTTPKSDKKEYWDGDIKWITPADFSTEDVFIEKGKRNISSEGFSSCSLEFVKEKSLIFSKRAPIGKVCINIEKMCINQGCLACVKKIDLEIKFFYYLLSVLTEYFELFGSGTTFKEISLISFSDFKVSVPTLAEQQQIATYLDKVCTKIDSLIAEKESLIADLAEYKKSLIFEVATGKKQVSSCEFSKENSGKRSV